MLVTPLCLQTNALNISTDTNEYVKDIAGPFDCIEEDIVTDWTGWKKRAPRAKIHPRNYGQFAYQRGGGHDEED